MESPASAPRGRSRSSARKRATFTSDPYTQQNSSTVTSTEPNDQNSSGTPSANMESPTYSFETPSPSASHSNRTRNRVAEYGMPSSDDVDSKGRRSLRKRARVDYTFDHVDQGVNDANKTTSSSTRALKKRRTDASSNELGTYDEPGDAHMNRGSSELPPPPASSGRRRNQARKSLRSDPLQMDDVEVQDTIEVAAHHSEHSEESNLRHMSSPTSSSPSGRDAMARSFDSPLGFLVNQALADFYEDESRIPVEGLDATQSSLAYTPHNIADVPSPNLYDHLTPYIKGAFVRWPSAHPEAEQNSDSQPIQHDGTAETPEYTSAADFAMLRSTPVDDAMEDTPAVSPSAMGTGANSPVADVELPYFPPPPRRPIVFKQTRDASEFTSLFDDYESLSHEDLYARLEIANRAMVAWQAEFNELRKITDDEDNAVRYRQEEAAFEHRVKMARSKDPSANPIRKKEFVVRGIRAERPHPEIAYARQQDKLMADIYGFVYDDRESMIGFQDPLQQKPGAGKARLRNRPKQTAKAAEADDGIIVHGKRTRKPAALFDPSEPASRGSTPVPTQRRRRQVGNGVDDVENNVEDTKDAGTEVPIPTATNAFVEQSATKASIEQSTPQPTPQTTPKKKGKGGRPRKHPLPAPAPRDDAAPADEVQPPAEQMETKPTRKRQRRTAELDAPKAAEEEAKAPAMNGVHKQAPSVKGIVHHNHSQIQEVPSDSFYTSSMQSMNARDDSRPTTSSSTATQSTVASVSNNYQLREKRQRKFSLNPEDDDGEPKPKRVRRSKKTQVEDFASTTAPVLTSSSLSAQQPASEPLPGPKLPTPKPPTKIKLMNYTPPVPFSVPPPASMPTQNPVSVPSSLCSTPPLSSNGTSNDGANGIDPNDPKDYSQMTKSEKMSHSMKARWANGSMTGAVEKRRATLANKKQAVKATEPGQLLEVAPSPPIMMQP